MPNFSNMEHNERLGLLANLGLQPSYGLCAVASLEVLRVTEETTRGHGAMDGFGRLMLRGLGRTDALQPVHEGRSQVPRSLEQAHKRPFGAWFYMVSEHVLGYVMLLGYVWT